jgi:hypothetical protein
MKYPCNLPSDLAVELYVTDPGLVAGGVRGAANLSRSTYPPHRHSHEDLPDEAAHEGMYDVRVDPPDGCGPRTKRCIERSPRTQPSSGRRNARDWLSRDSTLRPTAAAWPAGQMRFHGSPDPWGSAENSGARPKQWGRRRLVDGSPTTSYTPGPPCERSHAVPGPLVRGGAARSSGSAPRVARLSEASRSGDAPVAALHEFMIRVDAGPAAIRCPARAVPGLSL